jgi:hypothetical protein
MEEIKEKQPQVPKDIGNVKNIQWQDSIFPFSGAWQPAYDPTVIGPQNFKTLTNMRYGENGVEGINGYASRLSNAIDTYVNVLSGIHFRTNRTNDSYVLVQAADGSGNSVVLQNQTAIGNTGDFESTALHTDESANLQGRFSLGPSGVVAYCNTEETKLWSGEEGPVGAVFFTSSDAEAEPIDISDKLTNSRDGALQRATLDSDRPYATIMTTRPIKSVKVYVKTPNSTADTLEFKYWNGTAYAAVSNLDDGTEVGGVPLAQTGIIAFDSTVDTAKLHHFQDRYLYSYQMYLPSGSATIYEITCNMPMQDITNVWDGIYRVPIQCQVYTAADTAYEDFTLHVSESSTVNTPVGCILDGFTTSDELILMFEEKMAGIKCTMLGNLINTETSVMNLKYWDGDSWNAVTETDGTSSNGICFAQSGLISWEPQDAEQKQTLFGTHGYAYKLKVNAKLLGTKGGDEEVVIDIINGIPASKPIEVYKFPVLFKNKLFLCGYTEGNQGNRIDYCANNAPDVWNGEDSSLDGFQSIYVGGVEELTAAAQLYNRYGSNIFTTLIIFKNSEMYLLTGDGPLDYKLYPVSFTVGCPAPQTLTTAEVGLDVGADAARNVVLWISHTGPMMFDGATLTKATGLENYFDPNESEAVNWDYLYKARGWFDSTYGEWNVLLPTGSSTELDSWFVYDIIRKKWFKKEVGLNDNIISGFNVIATSGDQYIYGGSSTGKIFQLETGTSWDGSPITYVVQPGDFFPSNNQWDITRIRRFKFIAKRLVESDAEVELIYSKDTDEEVGTAVNFTDVLERTSTNAQVGIGWVDITASLADSGNTGIDFATAPTAKLDLTLSTGLNRLVRTTENFNEVAWCHNFKFSFTSDSSPKGLQPIAWGVQWEFVRKDEN